MSKEYSQEIVDYIERFYKEDDWKYEFRSDVGVFHGGISVEGKAGSVKFFVEVRENFAINYTKFALNVDEPNRDAVARFLTRVNYGISRGGFETDLDDGEIRYRLTVSAAEFREDYKNAGRLLMHLPAQVYQKYGDALLAVMFGFQNPDEAVREAERDD